MPDGSKGATVSWARNNPRKDPRKKNTKCAPIVAKPDTGEETLLVTS